MKIRDATSSDIPSMYAVDHVTKHEGNRKQDIREWVSTDCAIVADLEEIVIGYAVLQYTFFRQGFISMLIVDKAYRRKGVATALVSSLEEMCETNKIFTSTNESNEPTQALMLSLSYEPSGAVFNLDDGDPELFYFKRLQKARHQS